MKKLPKNSIRQISSGEHTQFFCIGCKMKKAYQIEFTSKDISQPPANQITHIGGRLPNGGEWKITDKEAMEEIRAGSTRYYVQKNSGEREYIIIGTHPLYGAFLTLPRERTTPKTLSSLPISLEAEYDEPANREPQATNTIVVPSFY